jgi:hypothetical protein
MSVLLVSNKESFIIFFFGRFKKPLSSHSGVVLAKVKTGAIF